MHFARSRPETLPVDVAEAELLAQRIVGTSPARERIVAQISRIAGTDAPALIEGETGSGKEVAARCIHYGGARRNGPFVPVNCGALPDALIESELYGHCKGTFANARETRRGLVAEAAGGTLFLDEVDALSARAQVALLRFLQDQRDRPIATTREHSADVRLIAASNRPLQRLVERGEFRDDLMYRLKILHLALPPLRDRGDDVVVLAQHFIGAFSDRYGLPVKPLHPLAACWLRTHTWPGNVRELENWVHREVLMCEGELIGAPTDLAGDDPQSASHDVAAVAGDAGLARIRTAKAEAVRRFESEFLQRALHGNGGNVLQAARQAGKLLKKHGLSDLDSCG